MSTQLQKRLQVLEARPPKVDPERDRRFHAAVAAMLDTVPHAGKWAPSKEPPFNWVEQPSDLELLWGRIKSWTVTDADNELMNAWPKCHLEPLQLVELLIRVRKMY